MSSRTKDYSLFTLSLLLSLESQSIPSSNDNNNKNNTTESNSIHTQPPPVTINRVVRAVNGTLVINCSNNYLICLFHPSLKAKHLTESNKNFNSTISSTPYVNYINWSPRKPISVMEFHPHGHWLCVCCVDNNIYLCPLAFLLGVQHDNEMIHPFNIKSFIPSSLKDIPDKNSYHNPDNNQYQNFEGRRPRTHSVGVFLPSIAAYCFGQYSLFSDGFGSNYSLVEIPEIEHKHSHFPIQKVIWWHVMERNDYLILISHNGGITFFHLQTHKTMTSMFKFNILDVEIFKPRPNHTALVINTDTCQHYLCYISVLNDNVLHLYPLSPHLSCFKHHHLQFPDHNRLTIEYIHGKPVFALYNTNNQSLNIYDIEMLSEYPIYVYHVPHARYYLFSSHFIFCVGCGSKRNKVLIVSKLLSWVKTDTHESILQHITLLNNHDIMGVFPCQDVQDGHFGIYTSQSISFCHMFQDITDLFSHLARSGLALTDAEPLGKTTGLDLHKLYEQIADSEYKEQHYASAYQLYQLSNARVSRIFQLYHSIYQTDIVISLIKKSLPHISNEKQRSLLDHILLSCYLYQHLHNKNSNFTHTIGNDQDKMLKQYYNAFLSQILSYSSHSFSKEWTSFIEKILAIGYTEECLQSAYHRGEMGLLLDLLNHHQCFHLSSKQVGFLIKQQYTHLLLTPERSFFLHILPIWQQLEILLLNMVTSLTSSSHTTFSFLSQLSDLIPHMYVAETIQLAKFLDPQSGVFSQFLSSDLSSINSNSPFLNIHDDIFPFDKKPRSSSSLSHLKLVDLFLITLVHLYSLRQHGHLLANTRQDYPNDYIQELILKYNNQCHIDHLISICNREGCYDISSLLVQDQSTITMLEYRFKNIVSHFQYYYQDISSNDIDEHSLSDHNETINDILSLLSFPFLSSQHPDRLSTIETIHFISMVFEFLSQYNFDILPFENFFREHLDNFQPALSYIVFHSLSSLSPEYHLSPSDLFLLSLHPKLSIDFSPSIYLAIIRSDINNISSTLPFMDKERLLTNIVEDMSLNVNHRGLIIIDRISQILKSSNSKNRLNCMAFSCGHLFSLESFEEYLLEFKSRLLLIHPSFNDLYSLIESHYHKKLIAFGCPCCFFNQFRKELIKISQGDFSIPPSLFNTHLTINIDNLPPPWDI